MLKKQLRLVGNQLQSKKKLCILLMIQMLLAIFMLSIGLTMWKQETMLSKQYESSTLANGVLMLPNYDVSTNELQRQLRAISPEENWAMALHTIGILESNSEVTPSIIVGNDTYFQCYQSKVAKGVWFSENPTYIEAVVTKDQEKYFKVGQIYNLNIIDDDWIETRTISVKVVGILDNLSYHFVSSGNGLEALLQQEYSGILINIRTLDGLALDIRNAQYYVWDEELTAKKLNFEQSAIGQFDEINERYEEYVTSNRMSYVIITTLVVIVLCLLFAGVSGCSLLTLQENSHTYVVYYINGMEWKQCLGLEWLRITVLYCIPLGIASIIYGIGYPILKSSISITYFGISLLICYMLYFLASIYVMQTIRRKKPIQIIKGCE